MKMDKSSSSAAETTRLLVFGAHPDDAEIFAGGLIARHARQGSQIRIISVTDGSSGHHRIPPHELKSLRRQEAAASGRVVNAEYFTWDFRDGYLQATIDVREAIIREIRTFQPDLVLTHRPVDYHPDHRATGTALLDASYLVTVPHICPDVPALSNDPVVAYMCDLFTRPSPIQPDIVLEVSPEFDTMLEMVSCHASQVFEWLPYHDGLLESVPDDDTQRRPWLNNWLRALHQSRLATLTELLTKHAYATQALQAIEVFEISEYAGQLADSQRQKLFPGQLPQTKADA